MESGLEQPQEQQPKVTKVKKPRTPAQVEATSKMLQAMAEKRKVDWDKKKAVIVEDTKKKLDTFSTSSPSVTQPIDTINKGLPDASVLALLRDQIKQELKQELAPKKRKRIIEVEDDSESEPEVIVRKKVKEPKQPVQVAVPQPHKYELLDRLFFK